MAEGETQRGGFLPVLLGLLVLGLLVGAVVQLRDRDDAPPTAVRPVHLGVPAGEESGDEPDDRAVEAVAVARSAVEAFYGVDHRTVEADLEEVRQLATGDFATDYDAAADRLARRVRAQQLVTVPTLVPDGTATSSLTSATAEVLVAVDVERRAGDEEPEQRAYRARVELLRVDGEWLVSGLEAIS